MLAGGAVGVVVALCFLGCAAAIESPAAIGSPAVEAPAVRTDLHITSMFSDWPAVSGESAGDRHCELYCGIESIGGRALPCAASYRCSFELHNPNGERITRALRFGPMADCMVEATSWGTLCTRWSGDMPVGWYRATMRCDGGAEDAFEFQVESSHAAGFSIPSALWRESNRCPERPAFEKRAAVPRTNGE